MDDKLLNGFTKPTKIIFAGSGILHKKWQDKLDLISVKHESVIINGATHCFDEEGKEEILFEETKEWFGKF